MAKKTIKTQKRQLYIPIKIWKAIILQSKVCEKDPNDFAIDILRSWYVSGKEHPILGLVEQLPVPDVNKLNNKALQTSVKRLGRPPGRKNKKASVT